MLISKRENVYLHVHNLHQCSQRRITIYVWKFVPSQLIHLLMRPHILVLQRAPQPTLLIRGIESVLKIVQFYLLILKLFHQLVWVHAPMVHLLISSHLHVFHLVLLPITLILLRKLVYSFAHMDIMLMILQVHVLLLFYALFLNPMLIP